MREYKPAKEELEMVMAFVMKWGWDIAIEDIDDDDPVQGMVIGTTEYLHELLGEDNPNFVFYKCHDSIKSSTHQ